MHPQTGEVIPVLFRMSAFMPVNVIMCWGLLIPNASIPVTLFWQWLNQSYNLAVNYANRNASNSLSNTQIGVAYGVAVTASCSIAVGLGQLVKKGVVPRALSHVVSFFFLLFFFLGFSSCLVGALHCRGVGRCGQCVCDEAE